MTKNDDEIVKVRRTGTSNAITIPNKPQYQRFKGAKYLQLSIEYNEKGRPFIKAELLEGEG